MIEILISVISGSAMTLFAVFLGAWIMHRGTKQPGEKFVGQPKGDVFSVPFPEDMPDYPIDDEQKVVEKTKSFLKTIGKN